MVFTHSVKSEVKGNRYNIMNLILTVQTAPNHYSDSEKEQRCSILEAADLCLGYSLENDTGLWLSCQGELTYHLNFFKRTYFNPTPFGCSFEGPKSFQSKISLVYVYLCWLPKSQQHYTAHILYMPE